MKKAFTPLQIRMYRKNRRFVTGFTLVELLIVIIIIGILATIAIPQYNKMVEKAKWSEAVNVLGSIKSTCLVYYAEYGIYPNAQAVNLYLNGSGKNFTSLAIDIPDVSKFVYMLEPLSHSQLHIPGSNFCVSAFIDKNNSGVYDGPEPAIILGDNGVFLGWNGAPQF